MHDFLSTSAEELKKYLAAENQPDYRFSQVWDAVYKRFNITWDEVSNIPKSLRNALASYFQILPFDMAQASVSSDHNTTKYLFQLHDGLQIETVLLKNENRNTVCISTQAGCPVGCSFCATGRMERYRNLSSAEIIGQVLFISHFLINKEENLNNIVLMGMGEPFLNYQEVIKSVHVFNEQDCFSIGARRITVSTIGIVDKILEFAKEPRQFNLAISLHAPNDNLRQKLIPISKKYPIGELIASAENYIQATNRRITYEYVLIDKINSKKEHAIELANLVKHQNCHVNLIALNPNDHFDGQAPSTETIRAFSKILLGNKIPTTIRNSQGAQIQAGCGQLAFRNVS